MICSVLLAHEYFYKGVLKSASELSSNNIKQTRGHNGPGSLTRVFFPTNEFYIFVTFVPNCDPRGGASFDPNGHHMNKIHKGLQGDATYQKSKLYPFQFQRRRIFEVGLLCSYVPTYDPRDRISFDPKGIIWMKLIKVHKEMLNTKYQSSNPSTFREEKFWSWFSLFLCFKLWPPGAGPVLNPEASYEQTW